jgi:hypothetical protein
MHREGERKRCGHTRALPTLARHLESQHGLVWSHDSIVANPGRGREFDFGNAPIVKDLLHAQASLLGGP